MVADALAPSVRLTVTRAVAGEPPKHVRGFLGAACGYEYEAVRGAEMGVAELVVSGAAAARACEDEGAEGTDFAALRVLPVRRRRYQ